MTVDPVVPIYDLPPGLHYFSGAAEILAGLGLILPGLTRLQTRLTPLAALGLVFVMAGAAAWHIPRGEFANVFMNAIMAGLAGFVAYGRWKLSPLKDKGASQPSVVDCACQARFHPGRRPERPDLPGFCLLALDVPRPQNLAGLSP